MPLLHPLRVGGPDAAQPSTIPRPSAIEAIVIASAEHAWTALARIWPYVRDSAALLGGLGVLYLLAIGAGW